MLTREVQSRLEALAVKAQSPGIMDFVKMSLSAHEIRIQTKRGMEEVGVLYVHTLYGVID